MKQLGSSITEMISRVIQGAFLPFLNILWSWMTGPLYFISRMLVDRDRPPRDAQEQGPPNGDASTPPLNTLRPRTPIVSEPTDLQDPPQTACGQKQTRTIQYHLIPGEWEREAHPHWPESTFRIPDIIPEGHVYYITKGEYVGQGATAWVERLPSGHIAKTPLQNPYYPEEERQDMQKMEQEYRIYCLLGLNPFVPRLIDWDGQSKTLVLENLVNGDLETYLRCQGSATDAKIRRKWALQAAQALEALHAIDIIHQDVTPRNYLLNENLDLRICDFAGSSCPGHPSTTGAPGSRYQLCAWNKGYIPTASDDIFSLGSVLYFIMCGEEPYSDLDEDEVEHRFASLDFPASDHLDCGTVIQSCWNRTFTTAEEVIQALLQDKDVN